jgi:hypothetical protein
MQTSFEQQTGSTEDAEARFDLVIGEMESEVLSAEKSHYDTERHPVTCRSWYCC